MQRKPSIHVREPRTPAAVSGDGGRLLLAIGLAFTVSCAGPAAPRVDGRAQQLRVTAIPDATCTLRASGSSDAGLRLSSDHSGRVSFQVRRLERNTPAQVQLDCDDAGGHHRSQRLDIDALLSEARLDVDDASEVLRVRPPLAADPATVTPRELAVGGYPPRPNEVDSAAYRDWLDDVMQPSRMLAFDDDATRDAIRFEEKTGYIWCGAVATSGPYDWVSAAWVEPHVKSSGNELQQVGGLWVGLGGVNDDETLIQAGTRFDVYPLSDTQYMKPRVFREVVTDPNNSASDPQYCKNCNFDEGDRVVFSAKIETRDGNGGGTGLLYYSNLTKGESAAAEMSFSNGFNGSTAEWILEDPLGGGTTLPDFGSVRFEGAQTYSDAQGYRDLGDNDYDTYADGGGDSPYYCKPNVVDSTSLDVTRVL